MKVFRSDRDLDSYRTLMASPGRFEDGFTGTTILGAFFIGFVMMPGAIYLGLIAGQGMGPAAEWVTIILFNELARRSLSKVTQQEIFVLYYIAGGLTQVVGGIALGGGPFGALIWNQYFIQSPAAKAFGLADKIPIWVCPPAGSAALNGRSFIHSDWLPAIGMLVFGQVVSRLNWFGAGYVLFRLTSDVERLPFPLAPVGAQGVVALAEAASGAEKSWKWRIFSIGMSIGVVFGVVYVAIPALSGLVLARPLNLLPIPWIDLTRLVEPVLPATPLGLSTDLGRVFLGFVLPFWTVVGAFAASVLTTLLNPILYNAGVLTLWRPGMDTVTTAFGNDIDVWMSVGIGTGIAVAAIGVASAVAICRGASGRESPAPVHDRPGRGGMPVWVGLALYGSSTLMYIVLCAFLLKQDRFPLLFLFVFGFLLTPLLSYVSARMVGLAGHGINFPMIREGMFILSGYRGADIWFAPIPYHNYGGMTVTFRQFELTGTAFGSLIKAELLILPIGLVCSAIFWSLVWKTAPIPSPLFQYAQQFWSLAALQQALWYSATTDGNGLFLAAIKAKWIFAGAFAGFSLYSLSALCGLPSLLIYGVVAGLGALPHGLAPEMAGALAGRWYFEKRFGLVTWRQYAPLLLAGFSAGIGLSGMSAIGITLICRSAGVMPY